MPRLGGYQKKRQFVKDENTNFFSINRTKDAIVDEYNRLKEIDHQKKEAEAAAEVKKLAKLKQQAEKAARQEAQRQKELETAAAIQANNLEGQFAGLTTMTFSDVTPDAVQSLDGAKVPLVHGIGDEWEDNATFNVVHSQKIDPFALVSDDWTETAQEPASLSSLAKPTDISWDDGDEVHDTDQDKDIDGWVKVPEKRSRKVKSTGHKGSNEQHTKGCFNCGGDHKKVDCPKPLKSKPKGECRNCGLEGHYASECPQPKKIGGGGGPCFICNEEGHVKAECPNRAASGEVQGSSGIRECYKCKSIDHIARECPDSNSQGDNRVCFNCNQPGHMSKECPEPRNANTHRPTTRGCCYSCGDEGHQSRNCPNQNGA